MTGHDHREQAVDRGRGVTPLSAAQGFLRGSLVNKSPEGQTATSSAT
jgi:hypothetical protein